MKKVLKVDKMARMWTKWHKNIVKMADEKLSWNYSQKVWVEKTSDSTEGSGKIAGPIWPENSGRRWRNFTSNNYSIISKQFLTSNKVRHFLRVDIRLISLDMCKISTLLAGVIPDTFAVRFWNWAHCEIRARKGICQDYLSMTPLGKRFVT